MQFGSPTKPINIMKHLITMIVLIGPLLLCAQEIEQSTLAVGGQSQTNANIQLDWTIGQNISATGESNGNNLSTGIHQPAIITEVLTVLEAEYPEIQIFPNPVVETLQVNISSGEQLKLSLMDLNGREILSGHDKTLDLTELSDGVYVLHILYDNYSSKHKIIKQNH